jgi:hypothetical protein
VRQPVQEILDDKTDRQRSGGSDESLLEERNRWFDTPRDRVLASHGYSSITRVAAARSS